jgi:hypothetical protein
LPQICVLQNCAKISGLNYTRYPLSSFFGKSLPDTGEA